VSGSQMHRKKKRRKMIFERESGEEIMEDLMESC
jgi:hypothetical protein